MAMIEILALVVVLHCAYESLQRALLVTTSPPILRSNASSASRDRPQRRRKNACCRVFRLCPDNNAIVSISWRAREVCAVRGIKHAAGPGGKSK
jgi:hypothetical protein